jgi:hypothetical protein
MGEAERRGAFDTVLEEAFAPRGGGEEVMGEEKATPLVGDSDVTAVAATSSFLGGLSVAPATALRFFVT